MKPIYFPPDAKRSGISITYIKSRGVLEISGWYDSCVGIESTEIGLGDFLSKLGVTMKDVEKDLPKSNPKHERRQRWG